VKAQGYDIGGIHLSADFPTGGIFSADGLHPTNIGYAVIADDWILAINATAGSDVPRPDVYSVLFERDVPQFTSSGAAASSRGSVSLARPPVPSVIETPGEPSRHR
jgi:hypothetical protein